MFLSCILKSVALLVVLPPISVVKTSDFTTTTTVKPYVKKYPMPKNFKTTMTTYAFEDLDWKLHGAAAKERTDCIGQYITCIRRTTPLVPVCGLDIFTWYLEDFLSICEIELENCSYRVRHNKAKYIGPWWINKIYHSGEDFDCTQIARRANNDLEKMEEIFFGGDMNTVLMEWNRRNYEFYYLNNQNVGEANNEEDGIIDQSIDYK